MKKTALLLSLVISSISCHPISAATRVWTDNTASYQIEAELSRVLEQTVELQTKEGRLIEVPKERLSKGDLEFVESYLDQLKQSQEQKSIPVAKEATLAPTSGVIPVQEYRTESPEPARISSETRNRLVGGLFCLGVVIGLVGLILTLSIQSRKCRAARQEASEKYDTAYKNVRRFVAEKFLVQPCSRCHEYVMQLLEVSPNARSVKYRCQHCGKNSHAAALSPDSVKIGDLFEELRRSLVQYRTAYSLHVEEPAIEFSTTPAPLPFEQTQRTPISENVRSEVWRRDQGKCTTCGSNANLQYDHIIPVARGGATTVKNLQLLCQRCNQAKGVKI